ncbi:MAG: CHAT domain-containing tetratricopeptide repeat protein [Caldilineaceae bacterium]
MKPPYLEPLLAATTADAWTDFLHRFTPSLRTIEELKEYAAQFHFSQPSVAVQVARKTYELSEQLAPPAHALGCWSLGNAYLHDSHYVEAAHYLHQARTLYLAAQQPLTAARLSVGLVGVMAYTGQPQAALRLADEIETVLAEAARHDADDLRRWAGLMKNCGVIYELLGDYEESIAVYQRCIEVLQDSGETHLIARTRHNRAYALGQIGAFDEALAEYAQAEELFHTVDSQADLVRLHINRCYILMAQGRYQAAIAQEERTRQEVAELPGLAQARPRLDLLRTQLYLATGQPITPALVDLLHQTEATFAANGSLLEDGLTWLLLGRCYRQMERCQEAQSCYRQVLRLVEQGADRALECWAYHGLAGVAEREHAVDTAIALYETAIDRLEQIRDDFQIETLRAAYLNNKLTLYHDLTALYLRQQRLPAAFQVAERAKARLVMEKLAAQLTNEVSKAVAASDDHVRPLAQQLQTELAALEEAYKAVKFTQLIDEASTTLRRSIADQEQTVQRLISEIQRQQPIFSTLTTGQTVTLAALQAQLGEIIFLQYHRLGDHFGVFVVANDGLWTHVNLGKIADVIQTYQDFAKTTQGVLGLLGQVGIDRVARRLPALLAAVHKHLLRLYKELFQPLASLLPAGRPLLISPDALLHAVPFHALYDGQAYLVETRTLSYTPSATVIDSCRRQVAADRGALLIGYDDQRLSAIAAELAMLTHHYPSAIVKAGAAATTEAFLHHAPQHRLIHVAAHAAFRHDKPMLSSITLANRRLTLAEISRLPLQADLVTLSGCETGAGQIQGTDVLSLASGFLGAGARSLLVSLWRVEDRATAQLMTNFYTATQQGVSYAAALSSAQRALLAAGRQAGDSQQAYQHPVFWAPFILLGAW